MLDGIFDEKFDCLLDGMFDGMFNGDVRQSTTSKAKSIGAAYEYILSLLHYVSENYGESTIFSGNHSLQVL